MAEVLASRATLPHEHGEMMEEKATDQHHHHHHDKKKKDDKKAASRRRKQEKQNAAATKIQAQVRGRQTRRRMQHNQAKKVAPVTLSRASTSSASTIADPMIAVTLKQTEGEEKPEDTNTLTRKSSSKSRLTTSEEPAASESNVIAPKSSPIPQRLPPLMEGPHLDTLAQSKADSEPKSQTSPLAVTNTSGLDARAKKIQATFRGHEGRLEAKRQREAVELELRREAEEEVKREEHAAIELQALYRGHRVRECLHSASLDAVEPEKNEVRQSSTSLSKSDDKKRPLTTQLAKEGAPEAKSRPEATSHTSNNSSEAKKKEEDPIKPREWPTPLKVTKEIDVSKHTTQDILASGVLRVFVMTWNLQAQKPPPDLHSVVVPNTSHIYAIGTEECVKSIAKSVLFTSKKEWEDILKETLGENYVMLRSHALTAMHNVVFVHKSVLPLVSHLHSDAIATGLGNQLGNKGGVGIGFVVGLTSFAFVGCHFEAHQSQQALQRRNANFHKINNELQLVDATDEHRKGPIADTFDRVFWCGDLNYRIDGNRRMIDDLLARNFHDVLLVNDQLRKEMQAGRVFQKFVEGPLHFRPTYKFDKGCDIYDTSPKQRIPSWTDRILYKSATPKGIVQQSYQSHMHIKTSDHRPVTAVFDVSFASHTSSKQGTTRADQTKSEVCTIQ